MEVYLDSCIVIYLVQAPEPFHQRTDTLFRHALQRQTHFCISDLTRLECRLGPKRNKQPELLERFDEFFAQPEIERKLISQSVFDLATDLRAEHRLKIPDALHLATAIHYNCNEFWTNDLRLTGVARENLKIVIPLETEPDG